MKKVISIIIILILCLSFAACENDSGTQEGSVDVKVKITVGSNEFIATLYDNETTQVLADMLPMTLNMSELNGNEKHYYLTENLPTSATNPGTIQTGDIMLYGSNSLVLFYKSFSTSYSYTKIGKIEDVESLAAALGNGSVIVQFELIESDTSGKSETPTEPTEPNEPENPTEPENPNEPTEPEPTEPETPIENEVTKMFITINGNIFKAELYDNQTAKALAALLPMSINMSELNNNEKYYYLPNSLPTSATNQGTIQTGDIMLYGSSCLVLFYKSFSTSYSYTKIGRIENTTGLVAALGIGSVTVVFSI